MDKAICKLLQTFETTESIYWIYVYKELGVPEDQRSIQILYVLCVNQP